MTIYVIAADCLCPVYYLTMLVIIHITDHISIQSKSIHCADEGNEILNAENSKPHQTQPTTSAGQSEGKLLKENANFSLFHFYQITFSHQGKVFFTRSLSPACTEQSGNLGNALFLCSSKHVHPHSTLEFRMNQYELQFRRLMR